MRHKIRFKLCFSCCIIFSLLLTFQSGFSEENPGIIGLNHQGIGHESSGPLFQQNDSQSLEPASKGRYYCKFVLGAGVSFDDIPLHMTAVSSSGGAGEDLWIREEL